MIGGKAQAILDLHDSGTNEVCGVAETGPVRRHLRLYSLAHEAARKHHNNAECLHKSETLFVAFGFMNLGGDTLRS
jgi:hypothetical protein